MPTVDFASISQALSGMMTTQVMKQVNRSTVLLNIIQPAQDTRMPKGRQINDENWSHVKWLDWFLDNHSTTDLIPLGVWKKKKFIVADFAERDEEIAAMRAAFALEGQAGAIGILAAVLVADLPEGTVVPEVPEGWNNGIRYRWEEYRAPGQRPLMFGTPLRDRDK